MHGRLIRLPEIAEQANIVMPMMPFRVTARH
jgi:hypothetical protein